MVRRSEPQGLAFHAVVMLPMYVLKFAVAVKDIRQVRRVVLFHGSMEHNDVWFFVLAT